MTEKERSLLVSLLALAKVASFVGLVVNVVCMIDAFQAIQQRDVSIIIPVTTTVLTLSVTALALVCARLFSRVA